ncbi:MAG: winged helix-turn-helix domain-containing protein [Lachnoclostridium sp.]|jgi:transposase|nr:winged helix-turn-helix domain-containing protein [Lachnoclostridium sp.]
MKIYTEAQKEEIKSEYKKSHERRERNRLLALKLIVCRGYEIEKVSVICELSKSYIEKIVSKHHAHGMKSVQMKPQGGNNRYLTHAEEAEILEKFRGRAEKGEIVSGIEIQREYEKAVGHEVSNSQIYYVLERHEWRRVKPRKQHPKADPAAQEAYKKNMRKD